MQRIKAHPGLRLKRQRACLWASWLSPKRTDHCQHPLYRTAAIHRQETGRIFRAPACNSAFREIRAGAIAGQTLDSTSRENPRRNVPRRRWCGTSEVRCSTTTRKTETPASRSNWRQAFQFCCNCLSAYASALLLCARHLLKEPANQFHATGIVLVLGRQSAAVGVLVIEPWVDKRVDGSLAVFGSSHKDVVPLLEH